MKKFAPALFVLALVLLAVGAAAVLQARDAPQNAEEKGPTLAIETSGGEKHVFTIEIADTPEKMARGLMHRASMPEDHGMLFKFDRTHRASFWMKDTVMSLDIIFIAEDGRIVNIARNATPYSLSPIPAAGPAKGALEINGGMSAKLGLNAGDRVIHPFFGHGSSE